METIKQKIFLLHAELTEAVSSAANAQQKQEVSTSTAKELEVRSSKETHLTPLGTRGKDRSLSSIGTLSPFRSARGS